MMSLLAIALAEAYNISEFDDEDELVGSGGPGKFNVEPEILPRKIEANTTGNEMAMSDFVYS